MAIGLAEAGADIIGVSASLEETGSDVEKEVVALGRKFKAYRCDFADRKVWFMFAHLTAVLHACTHSCGRHSTASLRR